MACSYKSATCPPQNSWHQAKEPGRRSMRDTPHKHPALVALFGLVLTACGGGGGSPGSPPSASPPPSGSPMDAQRIAAASSTAQSNSLCTAVQPFYWEVGD